VHLNELESKAQSMVWKHCHHQRLRNSNVNHQSKIMRTLFWDMEGAVAVYFNPKGKTVNIENCCEVLQTKLKPAIRAKHRGKLQ
jgi:hypothetical protein